MKIFDPFCESNRNKPPRRKSSEVQAEAAAWVAEVDATYARALSNFGSPDYVSGAWLASEFACDGERVLSERALHRVVAPAMDRAGYVKIVNPKTKDGRWKHCGVNTTVWAKAELAGQQFSLDLLDG